MPGTEAPSWRFLITPRLLAWHAIMVGSVYGMLALGDWQLHRAESGNALSWAYTFEWPIFAVFAVVFWAKTIRDEFHPPVATGPAAEDIELPAGAIPGGPRPGARVPAGDPENPGRKRNSPRTTPTRPPAAGARATALMACPSASQTQMCREGERGTPASPCTRVMAYNRVVLIVLCVFAIAQAFTDDSAVVNAIGTVPGCCTSCT
jgi:hypothetical protein